MRKTAAYLVLSLLSNYAFGWSNLGHRVVMQIAYNNLSVRAKKLANFYNHSVDNTYASKSLVAAAGWLDGYRPRDNPALGAIHYIDLPFTQDYTPLRPADAINALVALAQANAVLQNTHYTAKQKGLSLRVLIHVMADIHQPMHTISRYSSKYPNGDKGGNLFYLGKNAVAYNLHGYWDSAGGLLRTKNKFKRLRVKKYALSLERKWPCSSEVYSPEQWVKHAHKLAVLYAYTLKPGMKPTKPYQLQVRTISERQLARAGCRLAARLNYLLQ